MAWVNTSPLVKTYTLEEFWELPEPPDHSKIELIAGVLYMTPPPGYLHDNAVSRIIRLFTKHLDQTGDQGTLYAPRAAIWTSPNTYLEPDLFYVSAEFNAFSFVGHMVRNKRMPAIARTKNCMALVKRYTTTANKTGPSSKAYRSIKAAR